MNKDTIVKTVPLSAYKGISARITHCGKDNNIYISFHDDKGDYIFHAPNAWRLSPEDTINIANGLSEASLLCRSKKVVPKVEIDEENSGVCYCDRCIEDLPIGKDASGKNVYRV